MGEAHELKRRLLHQAVSDNVGQIAGHAVPRAPKRRDGRRRPRRRRGGLPALFLVISLGTVAVLGWRLAPLAVATTPAPAADLGVPPAAVAGPAPARPAPRPLLDRATFAAPVAIDTEVFPLAVRRVVLDPGHGGDDHGAAAEPLREKDLALDIALRLRTLLAADGFEVLMTREDDRTLTLRQRAEMANRERADLFVSIHLNWIVERSVRGIETYHLGSAEEPRLAALARLENRGSGYSREEIASFLDGLYAGVRGEQSRELAVRVQGALFRGLRRSSPGLVDRGVKTAPFVVLGATEMPAILAEVSCLSNREEVALLAEAPYREHIARALHRGLESYASHVKQTDQGADL